MDRFAYNDFKKGRVWDISAKLRRIEVWVLASQKNNTEKVLWRSVQKTLKHELLTPGGKQTYLTFVPMISRSSQKIGVKHATLTTHVLFLELE